MLFQFSRWKYELQIAACNGLLGVEEGLLKSSGTYDIFEIFDFSLFSGINLLEEGLFPKQNYFLNDSLSLARGHQ